MVAGLLPLALVTRLTLLPGPFRAEFVGQGAEMLDGPRTQPLERGEYLASYTHPQKSRVTIRRVQTVGNPVARHVRVDVRPACAQHGADAIAILWGHRGKAPHARAAQDAHDHRLGAVIRVMAGGDPIGAHARCGPAQGAPALGPRARLEVAPGLDDDARPRERHLLGPCKGLGPVELVRALRTQTVVDPVCEETEGDPPAQPSKHVK